MEISRTDALTEVDPTWNISTLLANRVERDPDGALVEINGPTGWSVVTAAEFEAQVAATAKGLIARGVKAGERVAIMSPTRYEWTVFDFAIWAAGAVPVPIYDTSSADQIHWICSDSEVVAAIVAGGDRLARFAEARESLPKLRDVWELDDDTLARFAESGADVADAELDERRRLSDLDTTATVIYTSGTTGRPKGVELTHGNFVRLSENSALGLWEVVSQPGCKTLLFLPLAHVFARFIEVLCVGSMAVMGHCPDVSNLMADVAGFKPTFLLAVPRVLEKVYNASEQKAGSGVKLRLFRWAAKVSIVYSRALDTDAGPSPALKAQHALAGTLVYNKLREALGGNMVFVVSGGAPLGERLGHFYRGIGMLVLEGYGLTETTAPIVVNRPSLIKIGTVGKPFPGCAIKIAEDGEILAQGINVFREYLNNEEATTEALDADGWFHTGDLGALDDDGYLTITGRKKEIIVTAAGKNVPPTQLEDRLRGHPIVSQCVVVGDNRPFIGALVTLDGEMLPGWLANHGLPTMTVSEAARDSEVLAALQRAIDRTNEPFSRAEQIKKFAVLDTDFTEANGYLTPSLKVKRARVLADFAADIDALYGQAATTGDRESA